MRARILGVLELDDLLLLPIYPASQDHKAEVPGAQDETHEFALLRSVWIFEDFANLSQVKNRIGQR